jgi:hypothetical protein
VARRERPSRRCAPAGSWHCADARPIGTIATRCAGGALDGPGRGCRALRRHVVTPAGESCAHTDAADCLDAADPESWRSWDAARSAVFPGTGPTAFGDSRCRRGRVVLYLPGVWSPDQNDRLSQPD